jgi:hypothetical protein
MPLVPALLAACLQPDPATVAATDYFERLRPLLHENSLLAERVLFQAARVYNEKDKVPPLAADWTGDVVPLAEHLHHQASFVAAPDVFAEPHAELVDLWGRRALLYRQIGEAVFVADLASFTDARKKADALKLEEERWFDHLNETLAPLGLLVDPYP